MQQLVRGALGHERVGDAQRQRRDGGSLTSQLVQHAFAHAAGNDAALHRHDELRLRRAGDLVHVERLDPAHVHHARVDAAHGEQRRRFLGARHHASEREDGHVVAFADHARPPLFQHVRLVRQRDAFGRPARIADGEGAAQLERRMQRMHELGFVRGGKYPHMRDHAHVGEIEHAVVRGAVLAHDAGTVDGEHHVEIRQGVVDDHLVDGALEERGVQGHARLHAARRQTAGQAHRMFLGDAGVHETLGELLGERIEARAALHGCRDGHDAIIATSLGGQRLAEHARVRRRGGRLSHPPWRFRTARCRGTSQGSAPRARSPRPCA